MRIFRLLCAVALASFATACMDQQRKSSYDREVAVEANAQALTDADGEHMLARWHGIDLTRAYSPPCAFTPYATCPLPPEPNRLPLRIEAGERAPLLPD